MARLLHFLVPASFEESATEPVALPSFRPLSFLSALADRVLPDLEPEPMLEPAPVAEPAPGALPRPVGEPAAVNTPVGTNGAPRARLQTSEPLAPVAPPRNGTDRVSRRRGAAADAEPLTDAAPELPAGADREGEASGAERPPEAVTHG